MRYPFWPEVHSHLDESGRGWKATLSTETKYGTKAQATATGATTRKALDAAFAKLTREHARKLRADEKAITKAENAARARTKKRRRS